MTRQCLEQAGLDNKSLVAQRFKLLSRVVRNETTGVELGPLKVEKATDSVPVMNVSLHT
jgi:hypothetical protein